jgi:hypothetical protein
METTFINGNFTHARDLNMANNGNNVSTKTNHAIGDTAFEHNSAAKAAAGLGATLNSDGSVTVNIDIPTLLSNQPGSASFVGLSWTDSSGNEHVITTSDLGPQLLFAGNDSLDAGHTLGGDSTHQSITFSAADANALGLLGGNADAFDFVIRMANGTYSEQHATLAGLPNPTTDGHWVDVVQNGGFDAGTFGVGAWSGGASGDTSEGHTGFWTDGPGQLENWSISVNGGNQQVEIMTADYLKQVTGGADLQGVIHDGNFVDTQETPGGLTLEQTLLAPSAGQALSADDQKIYGYYDGKGDPTTFGHQELAVTVSAEDILGYGHTSPDDMLSFFVNGVDVLNVSMADFVKTDGSGDPEYNVFKTFYGDLGNVYLNGPATSLAIVDHSASDGVNVGDNLADSHFTNAAPDGNYGGDIGFALNHVNVLEWMA